MKRDEDYSKKRRDDILGLLRKRNVLSYEDHNIYHGRLKRFLPSCVPQIRWRCEDYSRSTKFDRAEYQDQKDVLQEKISFLVTLMSSSRHTNLFTGAGVSTGAGVRQRARGSRRREKKHLTTNAKESDF